MVINLLSDLFYETLTYFIIFGTLEERPSLIENQELRFVQRMDLFYIMVG